MDRHCRTLQHTSQGFLSKVRRPNSPSLRLEFQLSSLAIKYVYLANWKPGGDVSIKLFCLQQSFHRWR